MKLRVYVVEDDALLAMEIADRLALYGAEVCGRSATGEQALDEIPRVRPDVVLMDIQLAGAASGIETAQRLRTMLDVPVVILSAYSDESMIARAIGAEPFAYLLKPLNERELHATLKAAHYRHLMDRQRAQASKMESLLRMAGGVAHQLNNALQQAMGSLDLIRMELPPGNSHLFELVDEGLRATQDAADIARRVHLYTGNVHLPFRSTDLNELVRQRSASLSEILAPASALRVDLREGIPPVRANGEQLAQVLEALVTNSMEATSGSDPEEVHLSTGVTDNPKWGFEDRTGDEWQPGTFVYLDVLDHGRGMDADTLRHAFDPFYTTRGLGRGLGLPLVQGIARAHRARVLVKSSPGGGTQVRLAFPISDRAHHTSAIEPLGPATAIPDSSGTILLVEDDAGVRRAAQRMLERLGYRVFAAESGEMGAALFRKHGGAIGCAVIDLNLGPFGMDGVETLAALRRMRPGIAALLVSGYYEEDLPEGTAEAGFAGFLPKPFQIGTLASAIADLLKT